MDPPKPNIIIHKQYALLKPDITQKMNCRWMDIQDLTSSAVGRSLGSNASILSNKRRARGSALGNFWDKGIGFFLRMLPKYLRAFSFRTC